MTRRSRRRQAPEVTSRPRAPRATRPTKSAEPARKRTRGRSAGEGDRLLWIAAGVGVTLLVILLIIAYIPETETDPATEIQVGARAYPTWKGERVTLPELVEPKKGEALIVHLDTSQPMGGFLPFASSREAFSGFRTMLPIVLDHLVSAYGQTEVDIQWFRVDHRFEKLASAPKIRKSLFSGKETRLDKSIERLLEGLRTGEVVAGALVTDLVATGDLTGAVPVAKALNDWMESPEVRSGAFEVGLLGLRTSYWGMEAKRTADCREEKVGLGCWYSERGERWNRLSSVAEVPFYVLVFGKGAGVLDGVGRQIEKSARELDLEARWQLMTRGSRTIDLQLLCQVHKLGSGLPQFALFLDEESRFRCARDEQIGLTCNLQGMSNDLEVELLEVTDDWPAVDTKIHGDVIEAVVNCAELRENPPTEDLVWALQVQPSVVQENPWQAWHSDTDELEANLGKTLGLRWFVEKITLEPDAYEIVTDPLLKVSGNGAR